MVKISRFPLQGKKIGASAERLIVWLEARVPAILNKLAINRLLSSKIYRNGAKFKVR